MFANVSQMNVLVTAFGLHLWSITIIYIIYSIDKLIAFFLLRDFTK